MSIILRYNFYRLTKNSIERRIIMDLSIREHIINNFKEDNKENLRSAIEESIKENDEEVLPGMGVFFEIIWSDAKEELKNEMLEILFNRLQKEKEN